MQRRSSTFLLLFLISSLLGGCDLGDKISEVAESINAVARSIIGIRNSTDNAVESLQRSSDAIKGSVSDFNAQLADTRDKLIAAGQTTLANEVANLSSSVIGLTSAEGRCDIDFVRQRARETLDKIKQSLTLGIAYTPIQATICSWSPNHVDRNLSPDRRSKLEFWGYNIADGSLRLILKKLVIAETEDKVECPQNQLGTAYSGEITSCTQSRRNRTTTSAPDEDVTSALHVATSYNAVVNTSGNGAPIDDDAVDRLLLVQREIQLSDIAILQPPLPKVQTVTLHFGDHLFQWIPPRTRGDSNFNKQCDVNSNVNLEVDQKDRSRLLLKIFMQSAEPGGDYTEVQGTTGADDNWVIYQAPNGFRFDSLHATDQVSFSQRRGDDSVGFRVADVLEPHDARPFSNGFIGGLALVGQNDALTATNPSREFRDLSDALQRERILDSVRLCVVTDRACVAASAAASARHTELRAEVDGINSSAKLTTNGLVNAWIFQGQCGNNAGATAKVSVALGDVTIRMTEIIHGR